MKSRKLAHMVIFSNLQKVLTTDILNKNPNISPRQRKTLIAAEIKETVKKDKNKFDALTKKIVTQNSDVNIPCLLGADSYYYYALTRNILKHGTYSLKIKNGKYFDPLMTAPIGYWRNMEIHPYMGYLFHKILSFFYKSIPVLVSLSILPLVYFLYSVLLFLIICYTLKISKPVTILGAVFFSLSPIFIQRSSFGWYDSDPYNIIFLLLSIFVLLKIFEKGGTVFWTFFLGFISALYALFWQGWLFLSSTILISFLSVYLYTKARKKPSEPLLKNLISYLATLTVFAVLFISPSGVINSAKDIAGIFSDFLFIKVDPWPDIFLTVGELKSASLIKINALLGGSVFFPISILGFLLILLGKYKNLLKEQKIVIMVFSICCFLLAKSAERFTIFLLPSVSCLFVIGAEWTLSEIRRLLDHRKKIYRLLCICSYSILIFLPLKDAHNASLIQNPIYNKVWDDALKYIKTNTPKNSIINSWWPPGHFIRAVADRGVTFDGATLNVPQAYWLGKFWLSDNEQEAIGILRMLNSSGNNATEYLIKNGFPLYKAVDLISHIIILNKKEALNFLSDKLPIKKTNTLLNMTHPSSVPPTYCFLYDDMVESIIGLDYVKDWNFKKATEEFKKMRFNPFASFKSLKRGSKDNVSFIWSLAGGRKYIGQKSPQKSITHNTIIFKNGVSVNTRQMRANFNNLENKISGIPRSLIYMDENNHLVEKTFTDAEVKLSILLINEPTPAGEPFYSVIVGPPETLKSIIFRLYYFNAAGLKHFKPFLKETDPRFKTKIVIYEVKFS